MRYNECDSLKCVLTLLKLTLHCSPKVEAVMKISVTLECCSGLEHENEELVELFLMSTCKMKNIFIEQDYSCSFNLFHLMCILS